MQLEGITRLQKIGLKSLIYQLNILQERLGMLEKGIGL